MIANSIQLPVTTLVGLAIRTNNKQEMDPDSSCIAPLAGRFWGDQLSEQIKHRAQPGVTYCVYTDYESDETGEYTYFIGEEVDSLEDQDLDRFQSLVIPESCYTRLTSPSGPMPEVVIAGWQKIWSMGTETLLGRRKYIADFEIHDHRAANPDAAVVDFYIGVDPIK